MNALVTAPNSAIPIAPYRRKPVCDSADATGHAAGTLLVAPTGEVLLLRRSGTEENFAGHWALPGGGVDAGETPDQAAAREMREEIGTVPEGKRKLLHQKKTPTGMVFHTFAQPVAAKFAPTLNDEHSGYDWASLNSLPSPLHPAVAELLSERVGAEDTADFLSWMGEDEDFGATDSVLRLALDRDSVRTKRKDGQLIVEVANISKANICPYRGAEIPGWDELGLDPDRIYQLLRDPDELKKAAPTLNGVQLLQKHVPVNAEDHKPHDTVGSLGSNAEFDGTYLKNSLYVNAKDAIDGIESGAKRQLSAGYHYKPDMTAGIFGGKRYDGVMRDIVFNHVALVEDGRAGPDVVVGDSMENLLMKPTRLGALTLRTVALSVAPLLAMDATVALPKDAFTSLSGKTFKQSKAKLLDSVRIALDGKLRKGIALDATMAGLAKAIDAFEELEDGNMDGEVSEKEADALEEVAELKNDLPPADLEDKDNNGVPDVFDAEPIAAFLKEKGMADDDIRAVCDMLPKNGLAGDEDDDEAKKKAEADKEKEKQAMDEKLKGMVSKEELASAVKLATDTAIKTTRDNERAIQAALSKVKPYVGELSPTLALDSAADVYRHTLTMMKVPNADKLHADALLPILEAQPKPGARPPAQVDPIAMDSAAMDSAAKYAPGIASIRTLA